MSVYNGARHLRESVESILEQGSVDFEFVIINDGSTDESGPILAEYAARDHRVRLINQQNTGLTRALIRGCAAARGEFIARQDADDVSMPERLRSLARLLSSDKRILFASSWTRYIGPEGELIEEVTRPIDPGAATCDLLNRRMGPPAHGSVMFRKDAYARVGGYRKEFYYGQDSDLWLRLAERGLVAYVPKFLYAFRLRPDSISSANRDLQRQFGDIGRLCLAARHRGEPEAALLAAAAELRDHVVSGGEVRPGHHRRLAAGYYFIGAGLAARRDPRAAAYLWQAARTNPLHWRAWIRAAVCLATRRRRTVQKPDSAAAPRTCCPRPSGNFPTPNNHDEAAHPCSR